ncbi:MAG: gamma-glutamyl-gamma-aminobutyrate hydrolase family protein [Alphaproteobacteria bacterium]|nr:gamma-glutamyl-gamma-aminobutyrate hydrolase family protein [Alphaproteobacteria bacterium]
MTLPLIGIPSDVYDIGINPFHCVGEKYIAAVARAAHGLPLLIPSFGPGPDIPPPAELFDLDALVDALDGLLVTGSPSNVEPHHYGGDPSRPGTHHDPQRDAITLPLIRRALAEGLPVLAICRGIQELNVALGGTLHQLVHEVEGLADHRGPPNEPRDVKYAPAHEVTLTSGGALARLSGMQTWRVNSLHEQGIDRLADGLAIEARAPDGMIEAVRVKDAKAFALGVQWHPEWRFWDDRLSTALFAEFGTAAAERSRARSSRVVHGRVA